MKIIYGPKGTGKTKAMINSANENVTTANGYVVFLSDKSRYSQDIDLKIRFIDLTKFDIQGVDGFRGFIKGLVAANGDNEYIYIDGVARITDKPLCELGSIFSTMEVLEKDFGVKFIISCSSEKKDLPDFILNFVE